MPTGSADTAALPESAVVGVIGAGTMGAGIAQVAAAAGHRVRIFDMQPGAAERAKANIVKALGNDVAKGRLGADEAEAHAGRISPCAALSDLSDASLVIEAIIEDLAAKRSLFSDLETIVSDDAILASNTSSLSITALAGKMKAPGRIAGMHFFNPVPRMRLVEIISGLETDGAVLDCLHATAERWGKRAVRARSTPGFIVNRVARPFYGEGLRLLEEGTADPATLDHLMRAGGGFRMGPFELMDLIGLDVNYAVTCSVFDAYYGDPRYKPSLRQKELVESGRLGRKAGRGFYDYGSDQKTAVARAVPPVSAPRDPLVARGAFPFAEPLKAAGWNVAVSDAESPYGLWSLESADGVLAQSDGRSATAVAAATGQQNLVLCDWWRPGPQAASAVAAAWQCPENAKAALCAPLHALGVETVETADAPGLVVLRVVATLANEAADAVHQGVATARDVDLAMRDGVNYPEGPLEWAEGIGLAGILRVLTNLQAHYHEDRYRPSPLLRQHVWAGRAIRERQ